LLNNYFNKHITSDKRATVLSSINVVRRLALAIVSPIIGILADWSFPTTLIILGLIAVLFSFVSRVEEKMLIN
jgi:hypothetical protein